MTENGSIYAGREDAVVRLTPLRLPPGKLCRPFRTIVLALAAVSVTACATVDHNAAASLGTAGVQATQVLSAETSGAMQTLGSLSQWWAVEGSLVCIKSSTADLRKTCIQNAAKQPQDPSAADLAKIIAALNKQKQAIDTLNQAYAAVVDLAQYNAGQEAATALNTSFSDINSFLSAVAALPGGTAIPAISSTLEKVTGGVAAQARAAAAPNGMQASLSAAASMLPKTAPGAVENLPTPVTPLPAQQKTVAAAQANSIARVTQFLQ